MIRVYLIRDPKDRESNQPSGYKPPGSHREGRFILRLGRTIEFPAVLE